MQVIHFKSILGISKGHWLVAYFCWVDEEKWFFLEGVTYHDGIIVFRVSALIYCVDFPSFAIELLKKT